ncbi:branched-chain amino acid aminotransferase II [Sparassis latifolia]|uniref:Branched-chain-amino-acid aminotransferase n=1 Tax=Sparassis crispa TaxID=139825 RepID=A0A401GY08_9APHY|nr:Branched-chain-amino-acid aminotransferase, mitochondrial [Sparassis crispa]GBE87081.1 Branched-chain-amino-acid aminotransferase, mitochondrial [Sparassis crispa]
MTSTLVHSNGSANGNAVPPVYNSDLDVSKLRITLAESLKPIPPADELVFGKTFTDHMLVASYDPVNGWSAPEIKPYGPLSLDPASSCFQYSTNIFEGMKAYIGVDGKPRLFRPEMNMARMKRSADRIALPPFSVDAVLELIKKIVTLEQRWIPNKTGCSLYIRPTVIGTRPNLGVRASDSALLYIILTPAGPFFRTGPRPISLLAVGDSVRAWPGGTGGHKLALNYASTFKPQQYAEKLGYEQVLWLLQGTVTEAGAMNFFVVLKRDDGDWDVITAPLDGTILPGVTRDSCLALIGAHPSRTHLPHLPSSLRLYPQERSFTITDIFTWHAEGRLLEAFAAGTAMIVGSVCRIGHEGKDIVLPEYEAGRGPVAQALYERILDIQEGRVEWDGWSVVCE